jgi:hypothetical protein
MNSVTTRMTSQAITTIGLGNNRISKDGATALLKAVKANSKIISLDVGDNSIADVDVAAIKLAVAENQNRA